MIRDVIALREAMPDRPISNSRYAHRPLDLVTASARARSCAEKSFGTQPKSPSRARPGEFCVWLTLWAAPALLFMRSDGQAMVDSFFADPLRHIPSTTLALGLALVYVVTTGLLMAASAARLAQARVRYVNGCLFLVIAPAILVSLVSTLALSLAFSFSLLIWCFPVLL